MPFQLSLSSPLGCSSLRGRGWRGAAPDGAGTRAAWCRRNSAAERTRTTRPSRSRIVTGAIELSADGSQIAFIAASFGPLTAVAH